MTHVAIVGAGQAGLYVGSTLRQQGFSGRISLFGNERQLPYERPPLSKAYLLGQSTGDDLMLRGEAYYAEQNIELFTDSPISAIDSTRKVIIAGNNEVIYDQLVLTTGTRARTLAKEVGGTLEGVYSLRSLDDADKIQSALAQSNHVLIVGGGYIGLEMAAAARKQGLAVTLIEAAPSILQRVTGQATADFFRQLHQTNGVVLREGIGLKELVGESRVEHAVLENGETITTDCVIVGIGAIVNSELAEQAGIECDNGIKTDDFGRTSINDIWAAGDCTRFQLNGHSIRLESVQNAIEQATRVAQNILGANLPYQPKPWFWSDQYDVKLQIAGLQQGHNHVVVRPGEKSEHARSHWYYQDQTLLAVDVINEPRTYMIAKRLLEMDKSPDPAFIADPNADLKPLIKRGA